MSGLSLLCVILTLCFAGSEVQARLKCDAVRPYFEKQGFPLSDIPKDPISSTELRSCGGISSGGEVCCSADMELRLQARARDKHEKATRMTLQRLQQLFATRGTRFHSRIFRRRLERIGDDKESAEREKSVSSLDKNRKYFEDLTSCIDSHNDAMEYAELIEATYSWCFLVMIGCNTIMISVIGLQIFRHTSDPNETARFLINNVACMLHLWINTYMGQILINHSISIRYCILNIKWYRLSIKAQKLLPLMMLRCSIPCKLTAGKFFAMSMEGFGMFMKSSMSYFTLLHST